MISMLRSTASGLLAAGVGLATIAAAPAPLDSARAEGHRVTIRVSSAEAGAMTIRLKAAGGLVRLEMDGGMMGQAGQMAAGAYALLRDDGKMTMVLPSQGMAVTMDASGLTSGGGMGEAMRAMGMGQETVSNVAVTVEDLGAGEKLLGYATRRHRMRQRYTTTRMMMGQTQIEHTEVVAEAWFAADVPGLADGLQLFSEKFSGAFSGMGGGGQALMDATAAKMPRGFILKANVKTTSERNGSAQAPAETSMEVTEITKMSIPDADLSVPAGVQVMDMAEMMGQMMRGRGGR